MSSGRISGQREGWMGPTAKGSRRNRFSSSSPAQQQQQQQQNYGQRMCREAKPWTPRGYLVVPGAIRKGVRRSRLSSSSPAVHGNVKKAVSATQQAAEKWMKHGGCAPHPLLEQLP